VEIGPRIHARFMILLFMIALVNAIVAPKDSVLGNSYKLIYIHLPISIISTLSIFFLSGVSYYYYFTKKKNLVLSFALSTLLLVILNLLLSIIFMNMTWGGFTFLEPRILFLILFEFLIALFIITLAFPPVVTLIYSIIQAVIATWSYFSLNNFSFQLHPLSVAEMSFIMKFPLIFTFPATLILYHQLALLINSKILDLGVD